MIIDCFIFYNELDLLAYRLQVLDSIIDYFILVESTHTFTGREKPLYFKEQKHLFEKYKDKIVHVIVEDVPFKYPNIHYANNEQWKNEYAQRNAISRGLESIPLCATDVLIVSDVDEIPDPRTLSCISNVDIHTLQMDMYYYNLNTRFHDKWNRCKILSYQKYKDLGMSFNDIRESSLGTDLPKGGWHLSYFGDAHFIQNKINHFSHQELNHRMYTDVSAIHHKIDASIDLYDRPIQLEHVNIQENTYLPVNHTLLNKFVKS
jgi:beta-1,4-mannosyl-glycoprotein beta-1,4-N-acetylglucosaminyltransferase